MEKTRKANILDMSDFHRLMEAFQLKQTFN